MSKYPILPNGKVVLIGESGVGNSPFQISFH